jgi:hypothetical protein
MPKIARRANAAAAFAQSVGQPKGTQIYATVDYDPDDMNPKGPTINGPISSYTPRIARRASLHFGKFCLDHFFFFDEFDEAVKLSAGLRGQGRGRTLRK